MNAYKVALGFAMCRNANIKEEASEPHKSDFFPVKMFRLAIKAD